MNSRHWRVLVPATEGRIKMSQPHICPSCNCLFHQDFVCTTCGAEKLYDATVTELREQLAAMTQERDELKDRIIKLEDEEVVSFTDFAASQAREQQLREGLTKAAIAWSSNGRYDFLLVNGVLESTSTDDTALRQWGAKLLREMAEICDRGADWELYGMILRRKADELEGKK